jgi:purine-binding chemotaxis protein CheW
MAASLTPDRPLELCAFWVGSAVYAIDVARVDEVLPRVVPLPVPGLPEHVEGVVHLQGATVPIVDLRRLLPAGTPPRTAKPKVVVAWLGRRRVGLRVDGLAGVQQFHEQDVAPPAQGEPGPVIGAVESREGPWRLLDVRALLRRAPA